MFTSTATRPVGWPCPPPGRRPCKFVLPKVGKGYHTVVAVFRENSSLLGSRSPVVKLRILG